LVLELVSRADGSDSRRRSSIGFSEELKELLHLVRIVHCCHVCMVMMCLTLSHVLGHWHQIWHLGVENLVSGRLQERSMGALCTQEPWDGPAEPPANDGGTISFRLGNGCRVVRKFWADAPLEALYLFVELESASTAGTQDDSLTIPPARPSPDYRHTYPFKLSTAMPCRILPLPEPPSRSSTPLHQVSIAQFGGLLGANVNFEGKVTEPSSDEDEDDEN
jgi:hypothetical protein